jgi:hypothetical protein
MGLKGLWLVITNQTKEQRTKSKDGGKEEVGSLQ